MTIYHTPGVFNREIDQSDILSPNGVSNGCVIVWAKQGQINRPVPISTDKEYIDTFGPPIYTSGQSNTTIGKQIPEFGYGAYGALQFLQESSNLFVFRDFDSRDTYPNTIYTSQAATSSFASSAISAVAISQGTAYDTNTKISSIDSYVDTNLNNLVFGALGPGTLGNNIAVSIETFSTSADWKSNYDNFSSFSAMNANGLSGYPIAAAAFPKAASVFKVNIYIKATNQSWSNFYLTSADSQNKLVRQSPVESFYGSIDPSLQDDSGNSLFIQDVINGKSQYVYAKVGPSFAGFTSASSPDVTGLHSFGRDANGNYVNYNFLAQLLSGVSVIPNTLAFTSTNVFPLLYNKDALNINILIGVSPDTNYKQQLAAVAAYRLDCIVVNQVGTLGVDDVTSVLLTEQYGYIAPSYVALYTGYGKIYDNYNDAYVYLPLSVFAAATMARVDNIANPWDAPAGIDRATLAVTDMRKIWSDVEIGQLYDVNINSTKFIRGNGHTIWGQKTAQLKKSALDRVNVRRNLLFIELNVMNALLPFVFENNTVKTRLRAFSLLDGFMSGVQAGGGLTAYKVVCDSSNNTSDVIDNNIMNVYLYIQPARSIEYIQITTVVTRTGISFSEVTIG